VSSLVIGGIVVLIMALLMIIGVPIAFALGLTALISVVLFLDVAQLNFFGNFVFESLNDFALLSIPLFVLMGVIFGQSKASEDLFETTNLWLSRLRGGLAMSSVIASSIFAALTGSSPATSAAIGKVAIPEMRKRGYSNQVSTGAIVAGGTLGILIPPSVTLILYGISTEQSIGQLFLGGVVPGILVTLLFCLWIVVAVTLERRGAINRESAGQNVGVVAAAPSVSWGERFAALIKVLPFVILIASILGVLYLGIATPSEAAAVGALFAFLLVTILYRQVSWNKLMQMALETTRTSTMILMIVAFSAVIGQVLSFLNVPQDLAGAIAGLQVNRWLVFIAMNVLFLLLGFFLPPVSIILITMPVLFPVITALEFDPIWFGVVMTLNMEMGLITPPVGLNLYVVQGIAPDVPLRDILTGAIPYVAVLALGILILALFPGLVTWLPDHILGG
jgi:tripartite ATP-independent transporter DctM subunit